MSRRCPGDEWDPPRTLALFPPPRRFRESAVGGDGGGLL